MKSLVHRQLSIIALIVVLLGVAFIPGVVPSVYASATTQTEETDMPTIVLIHGAWADGTSWQALIPQLQRAGHKVVAVQLPLASLAEDVAIAKRAIESQTGPVIVVAHSYGGAVMTGAAVGNENVKGLVYLAAFAPAAGEPLGALIGKYPTELPTAFAPDAAGYVYIDPAKFRAIFAGDLSASKAAVMAATQKPAFGHLFEESLDAAAWETIPSWYLVATEDKTLSPEMEHFYAERMDATTSEIKSSHVVYISHPTAVFNLIEEVVDATAE